MPTYEINCWTCPDSLAVRIHGDEEDRNAMINELIEIMQAHYTKHEKDHSMPHPPPKPGEVKRHINEVSPLFPEILA